jgi:hypothetical protein
MKHRSSQTLFAHWDERRGARPMPERGEIDPGAIRGALGDTFVLSYNPMTDHPFRLAGTRVCALFCRELKGSAFDALWNDESQARVSELIHAVADDRIGAVASVTGQNAERQSIELELLLLPLSHGGHSHLRLIGSLAPLTPPWWLGSTPAGALQIGAHRYLGHPHRASILAFRPPLPEARVRHGLRVFDGGRN